VKRSGHLSRAIIASADFVKNHRATLAKFMRVLDGCIDWAYAHEDESSKMYAALNKAGRFDRSQSFGVL
jgi:ABC-type nitrate/sulfonate/bicarbonate transport system substrate-binding protein